MDFGIVDLSLVSVRSEPSDKAEMTNQLLFGDLLVINEKHGSWKHIRSVHDNYEGWIDEKQVLLIDEEEFTRLQHISQEVVSELIEVVTNVNAGRPFPVLFGSTIRDINEGKFSIGQKNYQLHGSLQQASSANFPDSLFENAFMFLRAPYLWGGKSVFGMDCSGFTQILFRAMGVDLLRDASQQATMGELVSFHAVAKPGDLMFFDNKEGHITHVGIVMADQKIIHASGQVRIDRVDHQGIYNEDLKKYTHQLRLIRRIL